MIVYFGPMSMIWVIGRIEAIVRAPVVVALTALIALRKFDN